MAEANPPPSSIVDAERKRNQKRKSKQKIAKKTQALESDRLDSLPWDQALAGEDPFALLSGGVEGGFFRLEEIDEAEYGVIGGMPELGSGKKKENTVSSSKSKKRKHGSGDAESEEGGSCVVQEGDAAEKKLGKKQKKRKKKRSKICKNSGFILEREKEGEAVEVCLEGLFSGLVRENP